MAADTRTRETLVAVMPQGKCTANTSLTVYSDHTCLTCLAGMPRECGSSLTCQSVLLLGGFTAHRNKSLMLARRQEEQGNNRGVRRLPRGPKLFQRQPSASPVQPGPVDWPRSPLKLSEPSPHFTGQGSAHSRHAEKGQHVPPKGRTAENF